MDSPGIFKTSVASASDSRAREREIPCNRVDQSPRANSIYLRAHAPNISRSISCKLKMEVREPAGVRERVLAVLGNICVCIFIRRSGKNVRMTK